MDEILPAGTEDMIDNVGEASDDAGETRRPNPRSFLMTKTGFQKFER